MTTLTQSLPTETDIPIDVVNHQGVLCVRTVRIPKMRLTEPFFLDSLEFRFGIAEVNKEIPAEQEVLVRPLHFNETDPRIGYIPLPSFIAQHSTLENFTDAHFIFHMSRCGSTLVSQMLATVERFYIISESTMVNAALDPSLQLPEDISREELLRACICALRAGMPSECTYFFLKFRSWNTFFLNEISRAFPSVPWMFVHRNGVEVMESVLRDPPGWLRSHKYNAEFFAAKLGISPEEVGSLSDEEFAARVLGEFCRQVLFNKRSDSICIDYRDIIATLPELVEKEWGIVLSPYERQTMLARTRIYSKDPQTARKFEADSERKRKLVSEDVHNLANRYVESVRGQFTN